MNTSNPYIGERRAGTVGLPLPGVSVRLDDETGEVVGSERPQRFCRILETRGCHARRISWTDGSKPATSPSASPDGYYTLCGRQQRPDHFRRIQYLSARNRRIPDGAAGDGRSGRGRRSRTACAAKFPSRIWCSTQPVDCDASSKRAAAKSWHRSKFRGDLKSSRSFRATRLGKVQKHLLGQ